MPQPVQPRPAPPRESGRAGLRAVLADPGGTLVAMDFDGTLAPICLDPRDSRPVPGVMAAMAALAARVGTLALVTGRPAADAVRLAGLARAPALAGVVVLGQHGLERSDARGGVCAPPPAAGLPAVRAELADLLAATPGVRIEDKLHSLVVHARGLPGGQAVLDALHPQLAALAAAHGLQAVGGRLLIEIRPAGVDKGRALAELATERQARVLVYAGDDVGDLPAVRVLADWRARGTPTLSICVDSPEAPPALRAEADLVLAGPGAFARWLRELAAALAAG